MKLISIIAFLFLFYSLSHSSSMQQSPEILLELAINEHRCRKMVVEYHIKQKIVSIHSELADMQDFSLKEDQKKRASKLLKRNLSISIDPSEYLEADDVSFLKERLDDFFSSIECRYKERINDKILDEAYLSRQIQNYFRKSPNSYKEYKERFARYINKPIAASDIKQDNLFNKFVLFQMAVDSTKQFAKSPKNSVNSKMSADANLSPYKYLQHFLSCMYSAKITLEMFKSNFVQALPEPVESSDDDFSDWVVIDVNS